MTRTNWKSLTSSSVFLLILLAFRAGSVASEQGVAADEAVADEAVADEAASPIARVSVQFLLGTVTGAVGAGILGSLGLGSCGDFGCLDT